YDWPSRRAPGNNSHLALNHGTGILSDCAGAVDHSPWQPDRALFKDFQRRRRSAHHCGVELDGTGFARVNSRRGPAKRVSKRSLITFVELGSIRAYAVR